MSEPGFYGLMGFGDYKNLSNQENSIKQGSDNSERNYLLKIFSDEFFLYEWDSGIF
jgi:hypothetical protein